MRLLPLCLALLLIAISGSEAADPIAVQIPVESFGRRPPPPIHGLLYSTEVAGTDRAVLIVPSVKEPAASDELKRLAAYFSKGGFNTLLLEPRRGHSQPLRALVEDVQSGVVYLKTSPRLRAKGVAIFAQSEAANAAAQYASANKQMFAIVDALVLYNPIKEHQRVRLADTLKLITVIPVLLLHSKAASQAWVSQLKSHCQTDCWTMPVANGTRSESDQQRLKDFFLTRRHGQSGAGI